MDKDKLISLERLINGYPTYLKTVKSILLHPFKFPRELILHDKKQFLKSIDYITYSTAILFLIVLPIYIVHDQKIGKVFFLIRMLIQFGIAGIIFHCLLWFFGARSYSLKYTLGIYAYLTGTTLPLIILISYPLLIITGPVGLFGGFGESFEADAHAVSQMSLKYILILYIIILCFNTFLIFVTLSWFSYTHKISKFQVFAAMFFAGIIFTLFVTILFNPVMNKIGIIADKIFEAL